jgi:hypothetical protein
MTLVARRDLLESLKGVQAKVSRMKKLKLGIFLAQLLKVLANPSGYTRDWSRGRS